MVNASSKRPQYFAALAAAIGAMAFGTALSWSTPTGPVLINGIEITDEQVAWVGSTLTFSAGSMCILSGYMANFIGRRTALLYLVIPFTFGWMLIIFAKSITMVIVGRALLGVSSGGVCGVAPIYIGEIAEKNNRGMLCSFIQLLSTAGNLLVYFVGYFVTTDKLSVICASIPLIFGLLMLYCPESPTYLMQKNKPGEASKALIWLRGKDYDPSVELSEIQATVKQPSEQGNGKGKKQDRANQQDQPQQKNKALRALSCLRQQQEKKVFKSIVTSMLRRSSLKALSISYGLFICQQMCGVNILIFYTADIFEIAKTKLSPDLSTAFVGVVAAFFSGMIADRFGRRILLLTSQFIVTVCSFTLGYYFFMKDSNANSVDHLKWLPICALCLFTIAFSIGLGPVPWVMLSELFAPDIKGLAGSISTSSSLTLSFIAKKTHSNVSHVFGIGGTFWLYTTFSLLGIVFVYFVVPETNGKSLSNIQQMLNDTDEVNIRAGSTSRFTEPLLVPEEANNFEMKRLNMLNKGRKTL